jgi:hypothetical protein
MQDALRPQRLECGAGRVQLHRVKGEIAQPAAVGFVGALGHHLVILAEILASTSLVIFRAMIRPPAMTLGRCCCS